MHINFRLKRNFISPPRKLYLDDNILSSELFWTQWYTLRFKGFLRSWKSHSQEAKNFYRQEGKLTNPLGTGWSAGSKVVNTYISPVIYFFLKFHNNFLLYINGYGGGRRDWLCHTSMPELEIRWLPYYSKRVCEPAMWASPWNLLQMQTPGPSPDLMQTVWESQTMHKHSIVLRNAI